MSQDVAIRMTGVTKTFGTVIANDGVDLDIRKGEVLSLLGENGSGKTSLMNMLSGIYYPDSGHIYVGGNEVSIKSPKDAYELGIGMIHQHFKLVDIFTAAENIMLGLEENGRPGSKSVTAKIKEICDNYGFEIDPNKKIYDMSVSEKQTLEIVKVLYRGADILILDEPTAVLTPQETEKLFKVIGNMKAAGKSVVIITHKLHEVLRISDRVAILRKGRYIGTVDTKDVNEQILTEMMVGAKVSLNIERDEPVNTVKRISVKNISCNDREGLPVLKDVSFDVYAGEILGIAGISGCGQKELLESIAGLQEVSEGGHIIFSDPKTGNDEELVGKSPRAIKELGVSLSFVPEDRLGMGLVASMDMTANMMLKDYNESSGIFVDKKKPEKLAKKIKKELGVVTPGITTPVGKLSGGNVQKVLVGREIASSPTVLMTAYAVRGLDINTSLHIYKLLNEQKKNGVAVIYVGEDLDVLLELCDKILVLCGGQVNGYLDARTTTKEEVGMKMMYLSNHGGK
ncbi:MAG: ABC transporter ATP-binding protein [Lachnospiraceae bacterium]|nr:ABC transporter ATP-binding protein [Lachnospiraceae bacterium]